MDYDIEDNINVAIMNDDLDEFVNWSNKMSDWENYYIEDFEEYFLHSAIRNKSSKILRYMINKGVNLNLKDKEKKTALHLSLEEGLCEFVSFILSYKVEFTSDQMGNNELHKWVTHHSNCQICFNLLVKDSPSFNYHFISKNLKGNSPLFQAVIDQDLVTTKFLISNFPFDLNESGQEGNSLLHIAVVYKNQVCTFNYRICSTT
jgi:ankyrin repeat protein